MKLKSGLHYMFLAALLALVGVIVLRFEAGYKVRAAGGNTIPVENAPNEPFFFATVFTMAPDETSRRVPIGFPIPDDRRLVIEHVSL